MLTIDNNGLVHYADDQGNLATIAPGDTELAQGVLPEEEWAQVQAAWTQEIVDSWQAAHPPQEEVTPPPTLDERLAAVEDAVLELMLGGLL